MPVEQSLEKKEQKNVLEKIESFGIIRIIITFVSHSGINGAQDAKS